MQQTALNLDGSSRGQLAGQLIPAGVPGRPLAAPTKPINSHDPITSATPSKIPRRPSRGPSISQLFPPFRTIECVDASCWGRFFDRNVQDGSKADFSLFWDGCKLKIVHFLSDGIYFFETNSSKNFRSLEHRYRFFFKNLRNEIRIAQWEKKQKEETWRDFSLERIPRERGIPFRMFRTSSKFFVERIGEGSVTIEEEEKIAERGGSCAPCDELISSNVAGTS